MTYSIRNSFYSLYYFYLIFFLNYIYGVESFIPAGRLGHSSVVTADKKLYIFGGIKDDFFSSSDAFYIDLNNPFSMTNPPWIQVADIPFESSWEASASDNNDIYLFGGIMSDTSTHSDLSSKSFIYKLVNSITWNIPTVSGTPPQRRMEMKAISNSGKIYIFGGGANRLIGSTTLHLFNEMIILSTGDSSWSTIPTTGSIKGRTSYSATLLSTGIIVYIGGLELGDGNTLQTPDISQIITFNTNSLSWSTSTASFESQVESRQRHTAVLGPDDQVIIFGGSKLVTGSKFAQASPDVAVLKTNNGNFVWSTPKVSSNIGKFPSLTGHTSDISGNYMIVAFGNITRSNDDPLPNKSQNVYLMDVRNFTWVNSYEPGGSASSENPTTKIIIASVCGVVGSIILMVGGYFAYRWYKRKNDDTSIGFPGSNTEPYAEPAMLRNNPRPYEHQVYNSMPMNNSGPQPVPDNRYSDYNNPNSPDRHSMIPPTQLGGSVTPQPGTVYDNTSVYPQPGSIYINTPQPQQGSNYPQPGMVYEQTPLPGSAHNIK